MHKKARENKISEKNNKKDSEDKRVVYSKNKDFISIIKNIWKFLWYDDSVWSWLANIVVAYLFIVFIFYPGMGALLNTSYPLVAVVSGSMEHMQISHNDNINPHLCGNKSAKIPFWRISLSSDNTVNARFRFPCSIHSITFVVSKALR